MKVIITEEQKKKLFVPKDLDKRDRGYMEIIGMNPVIEYLRETGYPISFDMSTTPDDWSWYIHDISSDFKGYKYLENFEEPVKKLFMGIADNIENIYHIWGEISITEENKLHVSFDYEISQTKQGYKTYQL